MYFFITEVENTNVSFKFGQIIKKRNYEINHIVFTIDYISMASG